MVFRPSTNINEIQETVLHLIKTWGEYAKVPLRARRDISSKLAGDRKDFFGQVWRECRNEPCLPSITDLLDGYRWYANPFSNIRNPPRLKAILDTSIVLGANRRCMIFEICYRYNIRYAIFPYHLILAVSYDVNFFAQWLKHWCQTHTRYDETQFIRKYKNWLIDVKRSLQNGNNNINPIISKQTKIATDKLQHFADLMSFMRPLSKHLAHKTERVPVNSVLSDVAIQHIMQFPDEKIQEMDNNEKTNNWGNVLEFASIT